MRRSREVPELLAPAGSWDGLLAALDAGADAVYLAGKRFGARRGAPNFDDQELAKAIAIANRPPIRTEEGSDAVSCLGLIFNCNDVITSPVLIPLLHLRIYLDLPSLLLGG